MTKTPVPGHYIYNRTAAGFYMNVQFTDWPKSSIILLKIVLNLSITGTVHLYRI